MISNLLDRAKEEASSRNYETVLLAFEKYNNKNCCGYQQGTEEFNSLLNKYIFYKIRLHAMVKAVESFALNMASRYRESELDIDKADYSQIDKIIKLEQNPQNKQQTEDQKE